MLVHRMTPRRSVETRTSGTQAGAALLGAGVFSGVASYAFMVIAVRAFGVEAFAPVAVIWSLWAVTIAGVSTPLQHWIIQTIRVTSSEVPVRERRGQLCAGVLMVAAVAGVVAWLARVPLYGSPEPVYPLVSAAVIVTAGLAGYVRGVLGGRDRFVALSATLVGDGLLRLVLLVGAIVASLHVQAAALAIPAATLIVIAWSSTFRLSSTDPVAGRISPRLGALVVAFLLLHLSLNAPPVLAAVLDATPETVSSLFAAFSLFRAPFLVVSVLATRISYALASRVSEGSLGELARFRRAVVVLTLGGVVLGAAVGTAPARSIVRLVYGPEVVLRAMEGPSIVGGSFASLGALLLVLVLAARGRASASLPPLVTGVLAGGIWSVLGPGAVGARVSIGFLVSQLCFVLILTFVDRRVTSKGGRKDPARPAHA